MLLIEQQATAYAPVYKPVEWKVRSTKFPVNTTPGEFNLEVFVIGVADPAAVSALPGLAEGDIFVLLVNPPAPGVVVVGQTVQFTGTTLGRYDGIHRITKVISPTRFVIDATNTDGSADGLMSKYYERYRVVFEAGFETSPGVIQDYPVEADPDGVFVVDIRKQAQRSFKDVFDIAEPGATVGFTSANGYITNRYFINAWEAYNVPTPNGIEFQRVGVATGLQASKGKFSVVVNAVQPYHHVDEWDGGTDLDWNDNLFPYLVTPTTQDPNTKRFLTYAPSWDGRERGIDIGADEDYFIAFLCNGPSGQNIQARWSFYAGATFVGQSTLAVPFVGVDSYILRTGPANIFIPSNVTSYRLELRNNAGNPITDTYLFKVDRKCYRSPRRFFALNKFGAIDAFTFTGYEKRDNSYIRQTKDRSTMPVQVGPRGSWMRKMWKVDPLRAYSIQTDTLTKPWLRYVADEIMESPDIRLAIRNPGTIKAARWWTTVIPLNEANELGFEHGKLRMDYAIGVDNQVQRR
jgi:hypothetical protein